MAHLTAVKSLSDTMKDCIQNCDDCRDLCLATVTHCLGMGGEHASPSHIRLLMDCAEICQTSANFMLRDSDLHSTTCGACAEVCERCADGCESMAEGDEQMLACAEACRRCAESCGRMAS